VDEGEGVVRMRAGRRRGPYACWEKAWRWSAGLSGEGSPGADMHGVDHRGLYPLRRSLNSASPAKIQRFSERSEKLESPEIVHPLACRSTRGSMLVHTSVVWTLARRVKSGTLGLL
jgi:hypothetical protein